MKKKRVLFICNWYPNSNSKNLGIFIQKHAKAINSIATLTTVALTIQPSKKIYNCQVKHETKSEVGELLHIEIQSRFWKFLTYSRSFQLFIIQQKMKILVHKEFDLIQSNVLFMSGLLGHKLSQKHKIPLIHVEHWSGVSKFLSKNFYKKRGQKALDWATRIVCVSDFFKKDVENYVNPSKLIVIPNIIDSNFSPKEKSVSDKIRFLAIANWKEPKNPFLFIDALSTLSAKYPNFELTMIGQGNFINEIKLQNHPFPIQFIDHVKNELIPKYFENCDYFVHASNYETFSIVPIESIMTGTPVIVSKVGVLGTVVNEVNGQLCDNNLADWIKKIELAIKKKYSIDDVANSIGNQFSEANVATLFQQLYDFVLSEST